MNFIRIGSYIAAKEIILPLKQVDKRHPHCPSTSQPQCISVHSQLDVFVSKWRKTLFELLHAELLALPHDLLAIGALGRNQNIRNDLDDAVACDTIVDSNTRESVDADLYKWTPPCNIDGEILVVEHSGKVVVVVTRAIGGLVLIVVLLASIVESISVQRLVDDNVVLQQSLEVLLAVGAEEEGINPRSQLLEGIVAWSKSLLVRSMSLEAEI